MIVRQHPASRSVADSSYPTPGPKCWLLLLLLLLLLTMILGEMKKRSERPAKTSRLPTPVFECVGEGKRDHSIEIEFFMALVNFKLESAISYNISIRLWSLRIFDKSVSSAFHFNLGGCVDFKSGPGPPMGSLFKRASLVLLFLFGAYLLIASSKCWLPVESLRSIRARFPKPR